MSIVTDFLTGGSKRDQASDILRQNSQFIQSMLPNQINTDFGTGQFSFQNLGDGIYSSSISGGPGHVSAHTIGLPDFSNLNDLAGRFKDLGGQYNLLDRDANALRRLGREANDIKPLVAPGFSDLRTQRLKAIEDARQATTSNLKDSLARRRVSGSSFGNDAISRTNAEFTKQKSQAIAESFLQEVDATLQILDFQGKVTTQAANILAAKLSGQMNALAGESGIRQFQTSIEQRTNEFNAAAEQAADATNVGIDLAMMQAAFGGTGQALGFLTNLANALSGANAAEAQALISSADAQSELFGTIIGGATSYGILKD